MHIFLDNKFISQLIKKNFAHLIHMHNFLSPYITIVVKLSADVFQVTNSASIEIN